MSKNRSFFRKNTSFTHWLITRLCGMIQLWSIPHSIAPHLPKKMRGRWTRSDKKWRQEARSKTGHHKKNTLYNVHYDLDSGDPLHQSRKPNSLDKISIVLFWENATALYIVANIRYSINCSRQTLLRPTKFRQTRMLSWWRSICTARPMELVGTARGKFSFSLLYLKHSGHLKLYSWRFAQLQIIFW